MDMLFLPMKLRRARNGDARGERGNTPQHSRLFEMRMKSDLVSVERPQ
jgi:hypothetical protein